MACPKNFFYWGRHRRRRGGAGKKTENPAISPSKNLSWWSPTFQSPLSVSIPLVSLIIRSLIPLVNDTWTIGRKKHSKQPRRIDPSLLWKTNKPNPYHYCCRIEQQSWTVCNSLLVAKQNNIRGWVHQVVQPIMELWMRPMRHHQHPS